MEIIRPLLEDNAYPGAKAVLLEKSGDFNEASNVLLQCLKESETNHEEKLLTYLSFAARIAENLNQGIILIGTSYAKFSAF